MIDLAPGIKEEITRILRKYLTHAEVRLVGSRAKGDAKPYADVDLLIIADKSLSPEIRALLNTAFDESNIPYKVDLLDDYDLSSSFRSTLVKGSERLISIEPKDTDCNCCFTTTNDVCDRAKAVLHAEPGLKLALLFGSAATCNMRADSDVDIAVLFTSPMIPDDKIRLAQRLERELHKNVDIVDLFALSGTILSQILCKGHVLIKDGPKDMIGLVRRMVYNQADFMPYVRRALIERQQRFIYG